MIGAGGGIGVVSEAAEDDKMEEDSEEGEDHRDATSLVIDTIVETTNEKKERDLNPSRMGLEMSLQDRADLVVGTSCSTAKCARCNVAHSKHYRRTTEELNMYENSRCKACLPT